MMLQHQFAPVLQHINFVICLLCTGATAHIENVRDVLRCCNIIEYVPCYSTHRKLFGVLSGWVFNGVPQSRGRTLQASLIALDAAASALGQ
eukprot:1668023-Amphidinium_carterae.1